MYNPLMVLAYIALYV